MFFAIHNFSSRPEVTCMKVGGYGRQAEDVSMGSGILILLEEGGASSVLYIS